jgi:hypothetical protein
MSSDVETRSVSEKVLMISSDGHATATRMEDYRPYMPARHHEMFDEFCKDLNADTRASRSAGRASMEQKYDPEIVELWEQNVTLQGRLDGVGNVDARLKRWHGPELRPK